MKNLSLFLVLTTAALLPLTSCGKSKRSTIQNKGSDTMLEVAQKWAESYREVKPEVAIAVTGGGSGGGITGVIDGTVDIANCSRAMKQKELDAAKAKNHTPMQHHVGYDGIAIFVHRDNPMPQITIEQLAQIYADGGTATRWSDLGVKMPDGVDDTIVVVSRQSNSGTYEYFREAVLGDSGKFRLGTRDMNGSKDVVDLVQHSRTAIGYSGLAYATPEVRMVPVVAAPGKPAVSPSIDTVIDRSYPISRPLYMYTIGEPTGEVKEYLDWIVSDTGQRLLMEQGYPPLRKL
ncbi:MAG: PstS family phosphate ABC transporter substrate-binding protein [Planctomycetota bacterium]